MKVGDQVKIIAPYTAWTGFEGRIKAKAGSDKFVIGITRNDRGHLIRHGRWVDPIFSDYELEMVSPLVILAREAE